MNKTQSKVSEIFGVEDAKEIVTNVFETSKGSVYFRAKDGRMVRFKSYHPEHGSADQGWKDLSSHNVFITKEDAIDIALAIEGNAWLRLTETADDVILELVLTDWRTGEIVNTVREISFQGLPELGLSPVELFDLETLAEGKYKPTKIHVGNVISKFH